MSLLAAAISFPDWLRPEIFTIGPVEAFGRVWEFPLRWYGLAYFAGMLLGWRYVILIIRARTAWAPRSAAATARGLPAVTESQIGDFFVWAIIGVMAGGRLGSVLFYNTHLIWTDPIQIIAFWDGGLRGMSFHGGLLGVALATVVFAYQQNIAPLRLGDLLAPAVPIGLFLGRLANFVNAELWGRTTDVPWGVVFCNDTLRGANGVCAAGELPRHPSQLYEAGMEGLILFAVLAAATFYGRSLTRPGVNTGIFLAGYGVSRFLLEFVRQPDAQMPDFPLGLTMGMMLSAPMIVLGAWLIAHALRKPPLHAPATAAVPA